LARNLRACIAYVSPERLAQPPSYKLFCQAHETNCSIKKASDRHKRKRTSALRPSALHTQISTVIPPTAFQITPSPMLKKKSHQVRDPWSHTSASQAPPGHVNLVVLLSPARLPRAQHLPNLNSPTALPPSPLLRPLSEARTPPRPPPLQNQLLRTPTRIQH
jgi:hypothetical protein